MVPTATAHAWWDGLDGRCLGAFILASAVAPGSGGVVRGDA
jgi:hypothetical protein